MFVDVESDKRWMTDGERHGWVPPRPASQWLRLPLVRAIRASIVSRRVERHYAPWDARGMARSGYDAWVVYAIARGWA